MGKDIMKPSHMMSNFCWQDGEEEDDLFNSSPFREAIVKNSSNGACSFDLSPCIEPKSSSDTLSNLTSDLKSRRKGYNTYIQNLRRSLKVGDRGHPLPVRDQTTLFAVVPAPNFDHQKAIHADSGLGGGSHILGELFDGRLKICLQDESFDSIEMNEDDEEGLT